MSNESKHDIEKLLEELLLPHEGTGPLLQRDYWAIIANSRLTPAQVTAEVAANFPDFAPEQLVSFNADRQAGELRVGEEMEVEIRLAGRCRVRVIHRDANSFTLGTLRGHPEAGRITFGAYRNARGDVIFHIRSRARSSSATRYLGYVAGGEPMQSTVWADFVDRVAHRAGDGVIGRINVETTEIEDEADDPTALCSPTFLAVGD